MARQNPVPAGCSGPQLRCHRHSAGTDTAFRQNLLLGDMPVGYIPGLRVQPQFQEKRQEGKVLIFKGNQMVALRGVGAVRDRAGRRAQCSCSASGSIQRLR